MNNNNKRKKTARLPYSKPNKLIYDSLLFLLESEDVELFECSNSNVSEQPVGSTKLDLLIL